MNKKNDRIAKKEIPESSVLVWEEPLVIPTYRTGKPDPNPVFYQGYAYQGAQKRTYPYPLFDKVTDIREDKTYKAVYLENKYVKICVLPEIGGRIFSAMDKSNNYDFIYRQHVIKPSLVGMLGLWISGGVEWNFPHHHRPTTFMPVDYALKENADGSKSIWIGETELRHRLNWAICLTLYPDRSYLESTIKLINPTPFAHSFLFWANAAVHANPEYQVIFPPSTEYAVYHAKNHFSQWPVSHEIFHDTDYRRGVDVSWWKNHPSPTSFFAWNCEDDFFGGYDHGKQTGIVYVANHHTAPGKKFFEWGNGPKSRMWDKILTEADGPYIELMAGGYSDNQPDYCWLQPYEVKMVKQYWYPIQRIGGMKNANLESALNLEVTPNHIAKIGFNATSEYADAKILLKGGGKVLLEETADLGPQKPFVKEVVLPVDIKEEDLQVTLFSSENRELITYKPVKKKATPMPNPVEPPPSPKDVKTVEELYFMGLRLEQFHHAALEPYPYYEEALRRDPYDYRTNTALGLLYCKRGLFKEAEEKFRCAIERATKNYTTPKDGEAYYYLGVALKAQGKYDAAYDAFFKAILSHAWHAAGYYSLAELECLNKNYLKSLDFLTQSISLNALNVKALNLKAAVLRRLGYFKEAEELALRVLSFNPLNFWAGNELYLIRSRGVENKAIKEKKALKKIMRDNVQSYLELAVDYGNCGFWDEAIGVLSQITDPNTKEDRTYPMVYYYLGYFCEKKGEKEQAIKYYKLGSRMPVDYCFPFRLESIDVLRRAIQCNPDDAHARYYLGNMLYDIQPENAIKEWERSKNSDDTNPTVHRNLGLVYARDKNDISKAVSSLEKSIALDKKDPVSCYELDQLYEEANLSPQKRLKFFEESGDVILERDDLFLRKIILYVQIGEYDKAIELLRNYNFHVWEGEEARVHNTYVDAHVLRGGNKFKEKKYQESLKDYEAALEYPENLGMGQPHHRGRASQIYYLIGTVYEALRDNKKATEFYEKAIAGKHDWTALDPIIDWAEVCFYQGLAFRKLGREDESNRIFDGLIAFGGEKLKTGQKWDFFATFGKKESEHAAKIHAHYVLGLGYLGKDKQREASALLHK